MNVRIQAYSAAMDTGIWMLVLGLLLLWGAIGLVVAALWPRRVDCGPGELADISRDVDAEIGWHIDRAGVRPGTHRSEADLEAARDESRS